MPRHPDESPRDLRAAAAAGVRLTGLLAASRHARVHAVEADRRPAVLKVIADGTDPVARRRFAREGRVGLALRHPHLVETLAHGADWILLGDARASPDRGAETLADRLRGDRSDAAPVTGLGGVAGALAHLHARGLVHRDVKPGNILIGSDAQPILVDLGALGLAAGDDLGLGEVIGSPAWMAPEQARGAPPRASADVYALALVLAHVLTHVPAFVGAADAVLRYRQGGGGPAEAFVRGLDGIADPALRALVRGGLSEEPAARPPAEAFARAAALVKA